MRRPAYRMRTLRDADGAVCRVRVVYHLGFAGYIDRWTAECTGCTEHGESGGETWGPFGCDECGYTGKRRHEFFVAFNMAGYQAKLDRLEADHRRDAA